jgi:hypothetical protein
MLLRELDQKGGFSIFTANVRVKQRYYSQWIPVQVSARNMQEAKKLIQAQYGPDATINGIRNSK